jgi:hypothetical protein
LKDFGDFVEDVLERFEQLQWCVITAQEHVELEPVLLRITTNDSLVWSIMDRLNAID